MNASYQNMQNLIFEHLNGRDYRIGLDLGVGSIGVAVVALQNIDDKIIPTDLIFSGSRIFTASIGAAERRSFRGARNSHRHNRNRLLTLWKLLAEKGMMKEFLDHKERRLFANTADCMFDTEVQKQSPYELRLLALSEKIGLKELGYALYHLANHRGSSSVRVNVDSSEEDKEAQKSFAGTREFAKEHNVSTFIELLELNNQVNKTGFRNKLGRKNILMPTRNLILNELNRIVQTQKDHYPEIFTDEFITRILGIINYENLKIVPEAGDCPFNNNEKKLPKCHFLNEERRLWEALNNVRIDGEPLTQLQKEKFYKILRDGKDLTESAVRKDLKLDKYTDITLQGRTAKDQKIKGFQFKTLENKDFWNRLSESEQDQFFADWTNIADDDTLLKTLQNKYHLSLEEAENALSTVSLIGDYAPVGKSAMKILLGYIKNHLNSKTGMPLSYQEAISQAIEDDELTLQEQIKNYDMLPYYGAVLSESTQPLIGKAWHTMLKDKFEKYNYASPHTNNDEKKYGRIANPVVHQTLNELRKIVNEIIEITGKKPSEVGIELSRELKVGADEREKISKNQNTNEALNARIFKDYCKDNNLDSSYILPYKLSKEQGFTCPYCIQKFNSNDVAQGTVDIDHILPYSQSADNSQNNLVMAHDSCNRSLKGAKTPYQAFFGTETWGEIEHFAMEQMPKKAWRFKLNDEQYKEWLNQRGFLARFSTDTSYIAKASAQYLQCLFEDNSKKNVRTLKGGETATLRKAWGLHGITHELGARFIDDENGVYFNPQKKMRLDHRHHALDAITIAYSTNSYTKLINTLHKKGIKLHGIQKFVPLPKVATVYQKESIDETSPGDKKNFSQYIKQHLEHECFISLKYDHDKNGALLADTACSILFEKKDSYVLVKRARLSDVKNLTKEKFEKEFAQKVIKELSKYSDEEKKLLQRLINHNENLHMKVIGNLENAEQSLIQLNEEYQNTRARSKKITSSEILKKSVEESKGFYYKIFEHSKNKLWVKTQPAENQKGVVYLNSSEGGNLCIDLYHDKDGKLCGEVIRKVNAMNKNFVPSYQQQGYTCIEKIYQGDTLEINLTDRKSLTDKSTKLDFAASVKAPNAPKGRTFVRVATFTEVNSSIQIGLQNLLKASSKEKNPTFYISSMQKWDVRRVVLSPLGLIKYRSQILKNKEQD